LKEYRILFLIGKDRPGIVDEVSSLLFDNGANIEDSRMATMGGCFSIMTLFSCTSEQLPAIKGGVKKLEGEEFETSLHQAQDPSSLPGREELPFAITVMAMDHPGIVQRVVHILHNHDVNIQSLNTHVARAPLSGAPVFDLKLEAGIPAERSTKKVKRELAALAAEMNLDLTFQTEASSLEKQ
jgi:glycine cleavage system transcriptional repressor